MGHEWSRYVTVWISVIGFKGKFDVLNLYTTLSHCLQVTELQQVDTIPSI